MSRFATLIAVLLCGCGVPDYHSGGGPLIHVDHRTCVLFCHGTVNNHPQVVRDPPAPPPAPPVRARR